MENVGSDGCIYQGVRLESRSTEASVRDGPLQKTEIRRVTGILDNGAEQFCKRPGAN